MTLHARRDILGTITSNEVGAAGVMGSEGGDIEDVGVVDDEETRLLGGVLLYIFVWVEEHLENLNLAASDL